MASTARTLFRSVAQINKVFIQGTIHRSARPLASLASKPEKSGNRRDAQKKDPIVRTARSTNSLREGDEDEDSITDALLAETLKDPDYFKLKDIVTTRDLFDARVHLGHKSGTRNPFMVPYLFGTRLDVDLIDLQKTLPLLVDALNFAAHIAFRNGVILCVSRHLQTLPLVESMAQECGEFAHCRDWEPGTFTNSFSFFGLTTRLPDLCIFISTQNTIFEQHEAVVESAKMCIPSIGIVDSSCDPRIISYPVPGNDDSPAAVKLYLDLFKKAILKGKEARKEFDKKHDLV